MEMRQDEECLMVANRRKATVKIKITNDTPPGDFEMTSPDLDIKKIKHKGKDNPMLTFNNFDGTDYADGFEVTFKLQPHGDYGFFVNDPEGPGLDNALSVHKIESDAYCPEYGETWPGFYPTDLNDQGRELVVINLNNRMQYFGFALFFARKGETQPSLCFDPIGNNQNSSS